ncbi:hypothetical protein RISK_002223 [Rhodopirellula islandica]|uniref:Uncharacterized protein n=1 Tax=Rhodopirellula islandica TaxID=595434 RepID=A0A0J1BGD1_RHOIS|nr:hypothetical protein RISK_002223 [Rhodopirellula islandica]
MVARSIHPRFTRVFLRIGLDLQYLPGRMYLAYSPRRIQRNGLTVPLLPPILTGAFRFDHAKDFQ